MKTLLRHLWCTWTEEPPAFNHCRFCFNVSLPFVGSLSVSVAVMASVAGATSLRCMHRLMRGACCVACDGRQQAHLLGSSTGTAWHALTRSGARKSHFQCSDHRRCLAGLLGITSRHAHRPANHSQKKDQ